MAIHRGSHGHQNAHSSKRRSNQTKVGAHSVPLNLGLMEKTPRGGTWMNPHERNRNSQQTYRSLAHHKVQLGGFLVVQWLRRQAPAARAWVRSSL